jgi:DNA mismatch repair protein MutL
VKDTLTGKTFIASMEETPNPEKKAEKEEEKALTSFIPQPFEEKRREQQTQSRVANIVCETNNYVAKPKIALSSGNVIKHKDVVLVEKPQQMQLFDEEQLAQQEIANFKIVGQVFDTYWILALPEKIYYVDQHAAHEKVMYERLMKQYREKEIAVQSLNPPLVVSLSPKEKNVLVSHLDMFEALGFELDEFGDDTYAIRSVPTDLYGLSEKQLFLSFLDELVEFPVKGDSDAVLSKIASMSCKAAVKGNQAISLMEAEVLMKELLACENPFNCPHGRPTIVSMTKYELEKKFKR